MNQVIVSTKTIRSLLEAHASMAAWYYQMAAALHHAGATVTPPSDTQRQAHLASLATEFPELAAAAKSIHMPRSYVPRPAAPAPATVTENEGIEIPPPPKDHQATPAMIAPEPTSQASGPPQSGPSSSTAPNPPARVNPLTVKYEEK